MSRGARVSAIVAFFALLLVGLLTREDAREVTATSFGKVPTGYGAVYDLLREIGMPVARSFDPPAALGTGDTVWWIRPSGGCAADSLGNPALRTWLEGGGTGVVFLAAGNAGCGSDARIAGIAIPERRGSGLCETAPVAPFGITPIEPQGSPDAPLPEQEGGAGGPLVLEGPLLRAPRTLSAPPRIGFAPQDAWSEAARDEAPDGGWEIGAGAEGLPFALSRRVGAGRLVVVAADCFLQNGALGRADDALVATDLALALGAPRFDERVHGLVPSRGTIAYLVRSSAAIAFVGLGLLALVFAWFGAAEPRRTVAELDTGAPTLETYVQSLAGLYAATRDHARVLARYRELTARRLRRHFGLPPDAPLASLALRLERRGRVSRRALAELRSEAPARSAADLARGVAMLDRLVEEATR